MRLLSVYHQHRSLMHYALSVIMTAGVNFLPIFILVRLLLPAEYAQIVLAKNAIFLVVSLAGLGMSQSVIRWINVLAEKNEAIYANTLLAVTGFSFPGTALLCGGFYYLGDKIHYSLNINNLSLLFFLVLLQLINFEIINWKRAEHKSDHYITLTFFRSALQVAAILISIYYYRSLWAYVFGLLIAETWFMLLFSLREIQSKSLAIGQVNLKLMWDMFLYGWPNAFIIMNGILLNTLDRYMLAFLQTNQDWVAFYDAAYILSTAALYMLNRIFNLYLSPVYMKIYKKQGEIACKQFVERMTKLYLYIGFVLVFGIVLFRTPLIALCFPKTFLAAAPIVAPICLGVLISGLMNMLTAGLYLSGKSWIVGLSSGVALLINTLCNVLLIPHYGMLGAAYSTLIAFLAQALLNYRCARPYLAVRFPIVLLGLGSATLYTAIWFL